MKLRLTMILWAVLIAAAAAAQDAGDAVTLTINNPKMDTITDGLAATARLQASADSDLIYKLVVEVPSELQNNREAVKNESSFADFGDGKFIDLPIALPPMNRDRWSLGTLFYTTQKMPPVRVKIAYAVRADSVRMTDPIEIQVTPRGPLAGAILGGFLGVLAMLILRFIVHLSKRGRREVVTRDYFGGVVVRFALGICVSTIVIFILRFAPATFEKLPVTADVKDWIGGFVVGFFFQQFAQYLAKKIEPEEPPATTTQPAPQTATA